MNRKHSTRDLLSRKYAQKSKSDTVAEVFRSLADAQYKKKDYKEAEALYHKGLVSAEAESKEYGMILANLSAVKFVQRKYQVCVELINLCMRTAYEGCRSNLYVREIKACARMGKSALASEAMEELEIYLAALPAGAEKDQKLQEAAAALNSKADKKYVPVEEPARIQLEEANPQFLNASASVELQVQCRVDGRHRNHVIAKKSIAAGHVLLVDKPQATISERSCSHCFEEIEILFPCPQCVVRYCSEACRENSMRDTHKWECNFLGVESQDGITDEAVSAFRLLLKCSTADDCNIKDDFSYQNALFRSVLKSENVTTTVENCCKIIAYIVQNKNLFDWIRSRQGFESIQNNSSVIQAIGEKLLKIHVLVSYNRRIFKTGDMFYPTYSRFTHSCIPNTSVSLSGPNLILTAKEDIAEGQRIYTSYIPLLECRDDRNALLHENFGFFCLCELCMYQYVPEQSESTLLCEICNCITVLKTRTVICKHCKTETPVRRETLKKIWGIGAMYIAYLKSRNIEFVYNAIKEAQQVKLNPWYKLLVSLYTCAAVHEISSGVLEVGLQYSVKIMSLGYSKFAVEVFDALEKYSKKLFHSKNRYKPCDINIVVAVLQVLSTFRELLLLQNPEDTLLERVDDLKRFYNIHKSIAELQNVITWV